MRWRGAGGGGGGGGGMPERAYIQVEMFLCFSCALHHMDGDRKVSNYSRLKCELCEVL